VTELQIIFIRTMSISKLKDYFNIIISAIMCFVELERNGSVTKHGGRLDTIRRL